MKRLVRFFDNLPIERKLLLASVIPVVALIALSLVTYRSLQAFSEDQEQLDNIYVVQRTASDYMRLIVDLETGFRGYVLTRQESYLQPYRASKERIAHVGTMLESMVAGREAHGELIGQVRGDVMRLIAEKEVLIGAVQAGRTKEAHEYVERGRGRAIMTRIRAGMDRFDQLERAVLNGALAKISRDRSRVSLIVLGGGALALVLLILALHLIARSITTPLAALAKAVGTATGGIVPRVPVLDRGDEIGNLTRVMGAMSAQISDHIAKIEKSKTELRVTNLSLSESEAKYRSIVDHAPFGIFTTKGTAMTFINRHNRMLAGLDPDQDGDPEAIRQRIHPEDRERVLSEFAAAAEEGRPYETVFRFLHLDGQIRKVLSRRIPIPDGTGAPTRYQGFNIDITALEQMQTQLSRSERLATLGQVAAGIAHEIRNPLVGIGANLRLLLDDTEASSPLRAEMEVILRETKRLDRIVHQIIEYARPQIVTPIRVDVPEFIEETLALLAPPLKTKRMAVTTTVDPAAGSITADRDQLKQVLLNIVQNAIDASRDGGRIVVRVSEAEHHHEPGVMIQVRDEGVGIQPDDLAHVFEPFFTSGKHHGTGLGLAICRNIIEAHGGDISLHSSVGSGTTATIWLPVTQVPLARSGQPCKP
jgi:PAS domain S-box-containing protein